MQVLVAFSLLTRRSLDCTHRPVPSVQRIQQLDLPVFAKQLYHRQVLRTEALYSQGKRVSKARAEASSYYYQACHPSPTSKTVSSLASSRRGMLCSVFSTYDDDACWSSVMDGRGRVPLPSPRNHLGSMLERVRWGCHGAKMAHSTKFSRPTVLDYWGRGERLAMALGWNAGRQSAGGTICGPSTKRGAQNGYNPSHTQR